MTWAKRRDLERLLQEAEASIDALEIRDPQDYVAHLKREEGVRDFLAALRLPLPEGLKLDLLKRIGAEPPKPRSETQSFTNALGMTFVRIPAGSFLIGSSAAEVEALIQRYPDERRWLEEQTPQHRVTISQPFYLSIYQVTQAQWEAVMGDNPSGCKGNSNRPVENVSWDDTQEFLARLSAADGRRRYALPSEAQWEYACRAGSTGAYYFGDDEAQLGDYAWYSDNADSATHPVGEKRPNAWGLYDMHGNVWEWCQDWHGEYSADALTDPIGPEAGADRVIRGGSWSSDARIARSAVRYALHPGSRNDDLGFRCLSSVPSK